MSVSKLKGFRSAGLPCIMFLCSGEVMADFTLDMMQGVTAISEEIYSLHMKALWMVTAIGLIVFSIMIGTLIHHRKLKGGMPVKFHHSARLEIIWASIPILILVASAFPATKALIALEQTADAEMTIKITAYQQRWHYEYMDEDFGVFSVLPEDSSMVRQKNANADLSAVNNYLLDVDHPMVIPVNTKVRLLTTANDVIHSWWVPDLVWKHDAIPGFINDNWTLVTREGTYRGQCAELCGRDHAYLPIVLKVVSAGEYRQWAEEMKLVQQQAAEGADRVWESRLQR